MKSSKQFIYGKAAFKKANDPHNLSQYLKQLQSSQNLIENSLALTSRKDRPINSLVLTAKDNTNKSSCDKICKSPKSLKLSHKNDLKTQKNTARKPFHNSNVRASIKTSNAKQEKKLKVARSLDNIETIKSYLFPNSKNPGS